MKKGQAMMEFLMVYGWAILVVLAGIGALAYFGVFDGLTCKLQPNLPKCQTEIETNNFVFKTLTGNDIRWDCVAIGYEVVGDEDYVFNSVEDEITGYRFYDPIKEKYLYYFVNDTRYDFNYAIVVQNLSLECYEQGCDYLMPEKVEYKEVCLDHKLLAGDER